MQVTIGRLSLRKLREQMNMKFDTVDVNEVHETF